MKKNFVILLPLIVLCARSLFLLTEFIVNREFSNWRMYAALVGACLTVGVVVLFLRELTRRSSTKY